MLLPLLALLHGVLDPGDIYNGRENKLQVAIPRVEQAELTIDGVLDEPAWREAALLNGFSQFQPVDGRPATDSTEVLVWYSPTAIHFGVRAYEAHGAVNATLADRDRIFADDHVQLFLGTFNDGRQATVFAVNPLGVQGDGTMSEGTGSRGGGSFGANASAREAADLSANFVFESKGRITSYGYEIEIRIPFKSLRYQSTDRQDWGINIARQVQHLGHEDSWVPVSRAASSFLSQSGTLVGLHDLRRGLVVDLNPSVVAKANGARPAVGDPWNYDREGPELGGNVRWGVTNNLTLNGTINPDFSQVEADVGAVQFDPRSTVFFPERRPFFLEGIENFATPSNLVYSRSIVQPDVAIKLTGKVAGTNIAFLSAIDDRATSITRRERPVHNILRAVRDLGGQSRLGFVFTSKDDDEFSNRVIGVDSRLLFAKLYTARMQLATSFTSVGDESFSAPLWQASLDRNGRRLGLTYSASGNDDQFVAANGSISRGGLVNLSGNHRLTIFGRKGSAMESYTLNVVPTGTWNYDRFMNGKTWQELKLHFNNNFALKGGWRVGGSLLLETFGYDPELFQSVAVERVNGAVTDTVPFTGTARLDNVDWVFQVNTPRYSRFSGSFFAVWGVDENFDEWSSGDIVILTANADWRPTDKLRFEAQYQHQEYNRSSDNSLVRIRKIPRLKVEYQVARPIFVRMVGQYDARWRDALRDDSRTDGRLLVFDPGISDYVATSATSRNDLRVDWLFSYQPTPGTVFFAGYGSSLGEEDQLKFRNLERRSDGFFMKMSYLFRL